MQACHDYFLQRRVLRCRLTTKGYEHKTPIRTSFDQRFNRHSQQSLPQRRDLRCRRATTTLQERQRRRPPASRTAPPRSPSSSRRLKRFTRGCAASCAPSAGASSTRTPRCSLRSTRRRSRCGPPALPCVCSGCAFPAARLPPALQALARRAARRGRLDGTAGVHPLPCPASGATLACPAFAEVAPASTRTPRRSPRSSRRHGRRAPPPLPSPLHVELPLGTASRVTRHSHGPVNRPCRCS